MNRTRADYTEPGPGKADQNEWGVWKTRCARARDCQDAQLDVRNSTAERRYHSGRVVKAG